MTVYIIKCPRYCLFDITLHNKLPLLLPRIAFIVVPGGIRDSIQAHGIIPGVEPFRICGVTHECDCIIKIVE